MKGHVPTPEPVVDEMVSRLFAKREPRETDVLLDPGCGDGPFIAGVLRYCEKRDLSPPRITGVELDPRHLARARARFPKERYPSVELVEADYLAQPFGPADYIVGNPPYVSILGLDDSEKTRYRKAFTTAVGRFDLYILFFEQSLANLKPGGRLVFITPEKFAYVHTAEPLRRLLTTQRVVELDLVDEATFGELTTYPTITTLDREAPGRGRKTRVVFRDRTRRDVHLPSDGRAWSGVLSDHHTEEESGLTLADVCLRVSAGIATGTDSVFVRDRNDPLISKCTAWMHPTISGRQLSLSKYTDANEVIYTRDVMLVPYDRDGALLPESRIGALGDYLRRDANYKALSQRTHVTQRGRAYYRFHDSAPMDDILRPKILCKDITPEPQFWADRAGTVVPRHTVYYAVPAANVDLDALLTYLNSDPARAWLKAHSQRAANGYYRLQSKVLQRLPVPEHVIDGVRPRKSPRQARLRT